MSKKTVLILCYTNPASDPRVRRQIDALKDYDVITCGSGKECDYQIYQAPKFNLFRKIKRFIWLKTRQYEKWYWDDYKSKLAQQLSCITKDVVIANDIHTLPLALRISSKVYFDAHEYHPEEWNNSFKWRFLYKKYYTYLCKKYIVMAGKFSTVSEGIAEAYETLTGIKPLVITNAASYRELKPCEVTRPVKLIHHGAAIPLRQIEKLIHMMDYLDNHILHLMLTTMDENNWYLQKLKNLAGPKVKFLDPVAYDKICETINKFDIGVYIMDENNINHTFLLPNKFFEFIQARLCIVVSPNPEMVKLVRKYDLGVLSSDFAAETMAVTIKNLSPEKITYYKQQSHVHAKELSAEVNIQKLKEIVMNLCEQKTFDSIS